MRFVLSSFLCLAIATIFVLPCSAGVIRDDVSPGDDNCPKCQTMASQAWYQGVGQVIWNESGGTFAGSATYIGGGWILTAAHIADGTNLMGGGVTNFHFFLGANTYNEDHAVVNPGWTGSLNNGQDIALVKLTSSPSVQPANLYTQTDELGKTGTIVGIGYGGRGSIGQNTSSPFLKRAGNNVIDVFGGATNVVDYSANTMFVDFDNPGNAADSLWGSSTPLPYEYLSSLGDSGGGMFVNVNGIDYLAGVDSVGLATLADGNVNSDYGDMAGFTRISQFTSWIQSVTGLAPTQASPILPGDYNGSTSVDAADYTKWRDTLGTTGVGLAGDGNHNNVIDSGDYAVWTSHFGEPLGGGALANKAVPEPTTVTLLMLGMGALLVVRWASLR